MRIFLAGSEAILEEAAKIAARAARDDRAGDLNRAAKELERDEAADLLKSAGVIGVAPMRTTSVRPSVRMATSTSAVGRRVRRSV